MDTTDAPQIIEHLTKSLNMTPYEVRHFIKQQNFNIHKLRWIPNTAQYCLCGETPKATGLIQIYQLDKKELKLNGEYNQDRGIKCATFGASQNGTELAIGDFGGRLKIIDIETKKVMYDVKAHQTIINCIDGIGGNIGYGAIEIVTGGRDGCVKLWDPRQNTPIVSLEPVEKEPAVPDCWCVKQSNCKANNNKYKSLGNNYNTEERVIAAGYDNGDIKFFDLKTNQLLWDTNVKNGVCGIEFDRKDIIMNKLVATTLEGKFSVFDLRTFHYELGYANLTEKAHDSTIWGVKHLPQNRDIFLTQGGNGSVNVYKYIYPKERSIKDQNQKPKGIIGSVEILNSRDVAQQPISSFDWNRDKIGLGAMCALDQTTRVIITTKLDLY